MSNIILTSATVTQNINSTGTVFVPGTVTITTTLAGNDAISVGAAAGAVTIWNDGTLISLLDEGIAGNDDGLTVVNGSTGIIRGGDSGVYLSGGANANLITNHGQIFGGGEGIYAITSSTVALTTIQNIGAVISSGDGVLAEHRIALTNSGSILGDTGVSLQFSSDGSTLANTGRIDGTVAGILATADVDGVQIDNSGHVTAGNGTAISLSGNNASVLSSGTIQASANGILTSTSDGTRILSTGTITAGVRGIDSTGTNVQIANEGLISGEIGGIMHVGDRGTVTNSGTVFAQSGTAILLTSAFGRIFNSGHVESAEGIGIQLQGNGVVGSTILVNAGTIARGTLSVVAVEGDAGDQTVRNAGTIIGDVVLNAGKDLFRATGTGSVEGTVFGGLGLDTLLGAAADDTLEGAQDNDLIRGGAGNDALFGGTGSDTVHGDAGDDTLFVLSGIARLYGGDGDDEISVSVDSLTSMAEARGGAGNDTFKGGLLRDEIFGGDGDDVVFASDGANAVVGGAGSDLIEGGADSDTLSGGADDDIVRGFEGADLLAGNTGNDALTGSEGNDTISGGAGDDEIDGGTEGDSLSGNSGRDTILGGIGNDRIDGGDEDDVLRGGGQADTILGGAGGDLLNGESGADLLTGGVGQDTFVFTLASHSGTGAAADTVTDFDRGEDTLDVSAMVGSTLVFRGTAAFSGGGIASLRFDVVAGDTVVRIDSDGNGTTNSEIIMLGITTLTAADFAL